MKNEWKIVIILNRLDVICIKSGTCALISFFSSVFQHNFCSGAQCDSKTFLSSKDEKGNRQKSIAFQYISVEIFSLAHFILLAWNTEKNCAIQIWARSPISSSSIIFCWSAVLDIDVIFNFVYIFIRRFPFISLFSRRVHSFTYRLLLVTTELAREFHSAGEMKNFQCHVWLIHYTWFYQHNFFSLAFLLSSTFCLRSFAVMWSVCNQHHQQKYTAHR